MNFGSKIAGVALACVLLAAPAIGGEGPDRAGAEAAIAAARSAVSEARLQLGLLAGDARADAADRIDDAESSLARAVNRLAGGNYSGAADHAESAIERLTPDKDKSDK